MDFDAIVIGSGISGGWAAKELTERGLKVLMVERGRMIEHQSGYENEMTPPWEMPFRGFGDPKLYREEYPIQGGGMNEWTQGHFANEKDNPYQSGKGTPFKWTRGYQLGGRSLIWGRQCYRLSDYDFGANKRDGHGVDWPIRYADLKPWYDHVEDFIGVNGTVEGMPQLPDGVFQPAMPLSVAEVLFQSRIAENFSDRKLICGRSANLTQEKEGRSKCQFRYICQRGCSFGGYFSTQSSTLPAARKTGRLTLMSDKIATRILYDAKLGRVFGVELLDAVDKTVSRYTARIVFANASTLNTVGLLLRSKSEAFPNGLANGSGNLGHYVMDHAMALAGVTDVPGLEDRTYFGNRPSNFVIPRFRNLETQSEGFLRGYSYQGVAFRENWQRGAHIAGLGPLLKDSLDKPGAWKLLMVAYAECLPRRENRVELSNRVDRWGMPQLTVSVAFGDNEHSLLADAASEADKMMRLLGGNVQTSATPGPPGSAVHEMGGACMGSDPATSVVNRFNQTHEIPNLFITDGAAMSSTACQNPSLTYMAMTARAADTAVGMMREHRL